MWRQPPRSAAGQQFTLFQSDYVQCARPSSPVSGVVQLCIRPSRVRRLSSCRQCLEVVAAGTVACAADADREATRHRAGVPLEKVLGPLPTQSLANIPLVGLAAVPPVSASAVGRAAVAAATDPSVRRHRCSDVVACPEAAPCVSAAASTHI